MRGDRRLAEGSPGGAGRSLAQPRNDTTNRKKIEMRRLKRKKNKTANYKECLYFLLLPWRRRRQSGRVAYLRARPPAAAGRSRSVPVGCVASLRPRGAEMRPASHSCSRMPRVGQRLTRLHKK